MTRTNWRRFAEKHDLPAEAVEGAPDWLLSLNYNGSLAKFFESFATGAEARGKSGKAAAKDAMEILLCETISKYLPRSAQH